MICTHERDRLLEPASERVHQRTFYRGGGARRRQAASSSGGVTGLTRPLVLFLLTR